MSEDGPCKSEVRNAGGAGNPGVKQVGVGSKRKWGYETHIKAREKKKPFKAGQGARSLHLYKKRRRYGPYTEAGSSDFDLTILLTFSSNSAV